MPLLCISLTMDSKPEPASTGLPSVMKSTCFFCAPSNALSSSHARRSASVKRVRRLASAVSMLPIARMTSSFSLMDVISTSTCASSAKVITPT